MGVPGLFSYLKKYNSRDEDYSTIKTQIPIKDNNIEENNIKENNDNIKKTKRVFSQEVHLYLDFNGGIYQTIKPEIKSEQALITHTIQYLDNLVKLYPIPQSKDDTTQNRITKLFIALDGVPPRAKMEQQRIRRYHSKIRKTEELRLFNKYAEMGEKCKINEYIDTNIITPGTKFMDMLSNRIRTHITNTPDIYKYIDVIFTDWRIPGEGEHKILEHLRENFDIANREHINNVIYGLDGDLIMLALASRLDNIYLLREAYEYGDYAFQHEGYPYLYLDISYLKRALIEECATMISGPISYLTDDEINRFIDDYICIMMLLGNDFMPKIKWMSIKQDGHQLLLETYFQLYNGNDSVDREKDCQFLYNRETGKINKVLLSDFIRILATNENKLASAFFKKRRKPYIHMSSEMTEFERQKKKMEFLPLRHTKIECEVILPIDKYYKWQERYYRLCHNIIPSIENREQIVEAYLHTFLWNIRYYLHGYSSCNWDSYYPYDYSPTLQDISNYLQTHNITQTIKLSTAENKPISPLELLTIVLPDSNSDLMPVELYKKMTKYRKIFFPKEYSLNIALHTRYYECTPVIPKININLIRQLFQGTKLTPLERRLNEVGSVFTN
jgi:5'-3' exonuclease